MQIHTSHDQVHELVKIMPIILRRMKQDPAIVADCPAGSLADSEVRILLHLAIFGDSGSSAIAEAIGMSRPAVTEAIDRLVAKSLVKRTKHEIDRRRVTVQLMPHASDFAECILSRWRDGFSRSLAKLDATEQLGFLKGMTALAESLVDISHEETAARTFSQESTTEVYRL